MTNFSSHKCIQKEIGDYILKQTIGEGSFSKVKLAVHKPSNNTVAIKIISKQNLSKNDRLRTEREISILSSLNHPHIIHVIEIIQTDSFYYIVMEYCPEGELFSYIVNRKRLSEEEASFLFFQIVNAVEYIHSKSISHRDLKPENILLLSNRSIKVIDFGLSNYFDNKTALATPCGSPCYAAPEMLKNKLYDGRKVDIWSIGIILYAMVCGYLPFDDKNTQRLYQKVMKSQVTYTKNISSNAKNIINQMLVKDPKKRITIEGIKKHPFYQQGYNIYSIKFDTPLEEVHDISHSESTTVPHSSRGNNKLNETNSNESFLYEKEVMRTANPTVRKPPVSKIVNYYASERKEINEKDKVIRVNRCLPAKMKINVTSPIKIEKNHNICLTEYNNFKGKISIEKAFEPTVESKDNNITVYYKRQRDIMITDCSFHERFSTSVEDEDKKVKKFHTNLPTKRKKVNQSIEHEKIIEKFYKKYNIRINYPVVKKDYLISNTHKKNISMITTFKADSGINRKGKASLNKRCNLSISNKLNKQNNKIKSYIYH